jgi:GH35 family endo-1,4-beta-xylanase
MKKYRIGYDAKSREPDERVWIQELIEAENIEKAFEKAKELSEKRNWSLNGVEEQE